MFYICPPYFTSGPIFILLVDQRQFYLNPRISQSTRHVLYLPAIFYWQLLTRFLSFSSISVKLLFEPASISKHPICFIFTSPFIYPIQFLSVSSIRVKSNTWTNVYIKTPVMLYIYPPYFISDAIFIPFVEHFKKSTWAHIYFTSISKQQSCFLFLPVRHYLFPIR